MNLSFISPHVSSMDIGHYHTLKINRITQPGAYLTDGDEEVLLPTKYVPIGVRKGEELSVFVYRDSEDRIISTTKHPHATVNQFAFLKVKDVTPVGAFLDWGIDKDLLVPFRKQKVKLQKGFRALVYLYLDERTDRVVATAKVAKHLKRKMTLKKGAIVNLLITNSTDLGVNVIVENGYKGLIYQNDLFHDVLEGDRMKGFVKQIRPDGKLDISLRKDGLENLELGAKQILEEIKKRGGFLSLNDQSDPEEIQSVLQMSKKNFKRSIGILYKKKLINLENQGIMLK
ncbi:MAG: S1-like domain-containing RNA-binding protein [Bacteroidota bacterium]